VIRLEVMRETIGEPVSRKDIIDGLIKALKTLYDEGRILKKDYESCRKQVPDHFLMEL